MVWDEVGLMKVFGFDERLLRNDTIQHGHVLGRGRNKKTPK